MYVGYDECLSEGGDRVCALRVSSSTRAGESLLWKGCIYLKRANAPQSVLFLQINHSELKSALSQWFTWLPEVDLYLGEAIIIHPIISARLNLNG